MEWTRKITTEFIQLYRDHECLWKTSSENYRHKYNRMHAYFQLVKFLKSKGMINATIKDVRSKIQNMRRIVRKETQKKLTCNGNYTPVLWYYDLFAFISKAKLPSTEKKENELLDHTYSKTNITGTTQQVAESKNPQCIKKKKCKPRFAATEWDRYITTEFILLYKVNECLWNSTSVDYRNDNARLCAYLNLVKYLKSKGIKDVTINVVQTKIRNMRRNMRHEKQKMLAAMNSTEDTKELYVPSLWYYNLLSFVIEDPHYNVYCYYSDDSDEANEKQEALENTNLGATITDCWEADESQVSQCETKEKPKTRISYDRLGKKRCSRWVKSTVVFSNKTTEKPDEYETVGMNFAAKLRKMQPDQQIFAELLIHKVCAKGLLQQLHGNFDVIDLEEYESHISDDNDKSSIETNNK